MFRMLNTNRVRYLLCIVVACSCNGCLMGADAQLTAADSLDALVQNLERTAVEYHGEVRNADAARRDSAVSAFVARVRKSAGDEESTRRHVGDFTAALDRLRQDSDVEVNRRNSVSDNLRTISQISDGLRRLAAMSLAVQRETRQRLNNLASELPVRANSARSR